MAAENERGAAVVEFALVMPILMTLLFGILITGNYFYRAHALQQVANDAARVAIAGLTKAERKDLIDTLVAAEVPSLGGIAAASVVTAITDTGTDVTVDLSYDATADLAAGRGFVPLPGSVIRRRAMVRLAGL